MYNCLPDTTRIQNVKGLRRRGWSEQIASLTHKRFFLFCFFTGATDRISGHILTSNTSSYVVLAKVLPLVGYTNES